MAENLQEYYKRMAEAIDTQLEQKGKAALFYPVGSGSGRIVWAWINAHPDAAVIWVVPGETRRGMRLEEAKRIGQEIPPRVQLIHCEDNTPQRCLELAKIRPACIILDGSREFTAFPCGERVRWLQRFSPQAKLLGLIDTDQPVSCCLAEAMFQGAGTFSISLTEALARGLVTPPAADTVLLWPAETALEEFRIQMKQWNAVGVPGVGEKVFTNLRRAVEKCGPALPRLREALPKGKQLVLCEDAAAMRRVTENLEALFGPDTEATILKDGWDQEMAVRFAASPARGAQVLVTVSTPGGLARLAGMAGALHRAGTEPPPDAGPGTGALRGLRPAGGAQRLVCRPAQCRGSGAGDGTGRRHRVPAGGAVPGLHPSGPPTAAPTGRSVGAGLCSRQRGRRKRGYQ